MSACYWPALTLSLLTGPKEEDDVCRPLSFIHLTLTDCISIGGNCKYTLSYLQVMRYADSIDWLFQAAFKVFLQEIVSRRCSHLATLGETEGSRESQEGSRCWSQSEFLFPILSLMLICCICLGWKASR